MAIFKINCFNKKMIVKNRSSSKSSVYSDEKENQEEFLKLKEDPDHEDRDKLKEKEETEPKWMNGRIRNLSKADLNLASDFFDNPKISANFNYRQFRRPRTVL